MRKLASIQRITKLHKVEELDNLLLAEVLGWRCLVKKEEFNEGDLGVFFEVDAVLPEVGLFEFMRARKYRVKTVKMRGVISQGLMMPIYCFPQVANSAEGDDVTELLGIKKYEKDLSLGGDTKGSFPDFVYKTDQERIQTCKKFLSHGGLECVVTEKMDGTSATYYYNDGIFGVCSRNQEMKDTDNSVYWSIAHRYGLEEKLKTSGKNIAIQGEIVGNKIQKNKYKLNGIDFFVFDAQDINTRSYYSYGALKELSNSLGLNLVPEISFIKLGGYNVEKLVEMSIGTSLLGGTKREGLVIKSVDNAIDDHLGRISFKVINPEFLLKYD